MNLIVAFDNNGVIGNNNNLPWRLKTDLKYFKNLTQNNIVIMGRKTFESIGKPLPNRLNIVLSRDKNFYPENTFTCRNKQEVLKICSQYHYLEAFVIGGAQIYEMFKDDVKVVFATKVDAEVEGDSHFDFDFSDFKKDHSIAHRKDENNEYDFEIFKYIKSGHMDFGQYADEVIDNLDDWFYHEFYNEYYNDSHQAMFENRKLKIYYNEGLSINQASNRFQKEYFEVMKSTLVVDLDDLTFKCIVRPSFSHVFSVICELNEDSDVKYGLESEMFYENRFWNGKIKIIK